MRLLPVALCLTAAFLTAAAAPAPKKPPGQASGKQARPNAAQPHGDPYSITVTVDASAAAASVAQNNAINGGRMKAWTQLSHRLVPQKDWSKLPELEDAGVQRLIRGYTVSGEKRSTTRYIAQVTYIFNPNAVRHVLRAANIGVTEQPGGAILLVAMSSSYNADSAWAQALAHARPATSQFPLVTPIGDTVDQSTLGPLRFGSATWGQVQPSASRVHAGEAVLLLASSPAASKMTVRMRYVGPGRAVPLSDIEVPIPAGTPPEKVYATAAEQAENAIEDAWKSKGSVDLAKRAKLVAEVRFDSLEQWNGLFNRLQKVPSVSDVALVAMNTGEARVTLSYAGSPDQLRNAAAQSNLAMAERAGTWWITAGKAGGEDMDQE